MPQWRSVPMGPLVFGDTAGYVYFVTKGDKPFVAAHDGVEISRHGNVADAMRAVETYVKGK